MHWEGFSETVLKSSFTIEQKRGAHFLIGLIGVCVAKKGIAFGGFKSVQSVYNFIIRFPQQEMLLEIMDNFKTGISNLYEYTSCD